MEYVLVGPEGQELVKGKNVWVNSDRTASQFCEIVSIDEKYIIYKRDGENFVCPVHEDCRVYMRISAGDVLHIAGQDRQVKRSDGHKVVFILNDVECTIRHTDAWKFFVHKEEPCDGEVLR